MAIPMYPSTRSPVTLRVTHSGALSLSQGRDEVHHAKQLAAVTDHLPVAGLPPAEHPVAIDHEGRAVGHVAVGVEDPIGGDDRPVHVAQEREGKGVRLDKGGVAERAIAADREQGGAPLVELGRDLSQAGELGRSDPAEVVAVEAEDHLGAAPKLPERDGPTGGGGELEVRRGLSPPERRHDAHSGDFLPPSQPPPTIRPMTA